MPNYLSFGYAIGDEEIHRLPMNLQPLRLDLDQACHVDRCVPPRKHVIDVLGTENEVSSLLQQIDIRHHVLSLDLSSLGRFE